MGHGTIMYYFNMRGGSRSVCKASSFLFCRNPRIRTGAVSVWKIFCDQADVVMFSLLFRLFLAQSLTAFETSRFERCWDSSFLESTGVYGAKVWNALLYL